MDLLIVLLILLLLAIPIAAIVGMVMAIGTRNRLQGLERQLVLLERRLDEMPAAVVAPSTLPPSVPERPAAQEPPAESEPISGPPPDIRSPRAPSPEPLASAPPKPAPA